MCVCVCVCVGVCVSMSVCICVCVLFCLSDQALRDVQNDAFGQRVPATSQGPAGGFLRGPGLQGGGGVSLRLGRAGRQGQHVRTAPGERHVERDGRRARPTCECMYVIRHRT